MQAIAFPFRFSRGKVVTVDDQTDAYAAQKILSAVSTRIGELPLLPLFGTSDPEFQNFDGAGLMYTNATYFPDVTITDIYQSVSEGKLEIQVEFERTVNIGANSGLA